MRTGLRRVAASAASVLTSPLLPDDYLKLVNPLWSARELRGRIVEVRPETADAATLVIRPGWGFRFDYRPGQYLGVGLLVEGRWRWRSYSLTSVPETTSRAARTVAITVKAVPEGLLSNHLVNGVRRGTVVRLAAPRGEFVMPDPAPPRVLFVTAGSGITPVMAMLRTMLRRRQIGDGATTAGATTDGATTDGATTDVVHLHSAPTPADVMFADELAALGRAHSGYRLTVRATRRDGRLDLGRIGAQVPDWREREAWVCGPAGLIADAERVWSAGGAVSRLRVERFTAGRADGGGRGGSVTFARSGRTVYADAATSLLEAGEQAGVRLPFGCRMGICHTCVVHLAQGRVRDLRTGAGQEAGVLVQTCVCAADGDCVLEV